MKKSFGNSYFEIGIYLLFGACVLEFNPSAEVKSSKHHVVKSEIPLAKGAGGFQSSSDSKSGADFYRATGESSEDPFCKTGNLRLLIYF
ncbi:MAG: hypothetical protein DRJ09_09540 [Bacteroidetes bacterium]|nr:MAG: hypothetical protein DRJ09_09540 [Bacteroidota bacterium]